MRFADPLSVTCPACGHAGDYPPRELVALRSRCERCAASLESIGLGMRSKLSEWSAHLSRMAVAIELEQAFGATFTDADLEAIKKPVDFVTFFRDRSASEIAGAVIAALTRLCRTPATADDMQRSFAEIFPITEHP